jgi:hypothetical protein
MKPDKQKAVGYTQKWRAKHPDGYAKLNQDTVKRRRGTKGYYHRVNLWRNFKLTPEAYEAMLNAQGGVCAICKRPPGKRRLAVDHDHDYKRNRGLLCHYCNQALALVEADPEWGDKALEYLVRYIELMVQET